MYVLVPDDPVFYAKFQSLEEPLLRHLYGLHRSGAASDDERVVADAYDSWVQVLLKLPLWARWHTEDTPAGPPRYTLYGAGGDQLTSLYPIDVAPVDLGHLTAGLDLFAGAGSAYREEGFAEIFRRVMEVLLLPAPPDLLNALLLKVSQDAAGCVTLPAGREREYRRFCEEIVTILSSGDTFGFRSHLAMYL
ncbi:hypothetical protein V2W30_40325 (plasmid) [Streptomyces sp. Q6]|uniref:Uncharacterized protein n=1 Tax=Streptomyces citrinus TaxID=3118173 RepID=A0ACD5AQD0_9ACTN